MYMIKIIKLFFSLLGRAITKSFILPFLLGFKFNLSLILPLLIGLLIIAAKKIVFISKLVLILSGIFGWGGPLVNSLGYGNTYHQNGYGHKPIYHEGYYKDGFHDKESGRGSSHVEVTEAPPYEFDRFYDYEKKQQNRYDRFFSVYDDDELKPRSQRSMSSNSPVDIDFQTSLNSNRQQPQFTWRTAD